MTPLFYLFLGSNPLQCTKVRTKDGLRVRPLGRQSTPPSVGSYRTWDERSKYTPRVTPPPLGPLRTWKESGK